MIGIVISGFLIIAGVSLQILVPLHLISVTGWGVFGIPDQIFSIFLGITLLSFGIMGLYLFHYKAYARALQQKAYKK